MAITADEAVDIVRSSIRNPSVYDNDDIARAILSVGNDFVQRTRCTRSSGTVTLAANTAEYDYATSAITDLRPEDFETAEIIYIDEGAWADATAYTVNDLVTENSKFWRCISAHTGPGDGSTQPDSGADYLTYWSRVAAKTGYPVDCVDYQFISRDLRNPEIFRTPSYGYADAFIEQYRPERFAFKDHTNLVVYPIPQAAWKLQIWYVPPFNDFDPTGALSATTLNVPERYVRPMLRYGVAAELMRLDPENNSLVDRYDQLYEGHVRKTAGLAGISNNEFIIEESRYL